MITNKRIEDALELKNLEEIEINTKIYKQLKKELIAKIIDRGISIRTNSKIKEFKVHIGKKDCFAYEKNKCKILKSKECAGCKFYKNNVDIKQIEEDIIAYTNIKG